MAPYLGTIPIPNRRGLAIAAPSYGGPSPTLTVNYSIYRHFLCSGTSRPIGDSREAGLESGKGYGGKGAESGGKGEGREIEIGGSSSVIGFRGLDATVCVCLCMQLCRVLPCSIYG